MSDIEAVDTLDLRGLFCPMPIVHLTQAIGNARARADIPAWAKTTGNEVLKADKVDKIFKFYIKKLK